LEASNTKLDNVLMQAEKDHHEVTYFLSQLVEEMKNRENVVASTNRRLDQLNEEHNELKEKTNKLEKDCQKSQMEYKNVCDNLDNTIANNKALTNKLKALEHNLRGTENELDQSILKREGLRKEHMDLVSENKILNSEIDKTLMSILEYERVNKELQREV
jgi:predicted  nucleic acid-binding Zn-ribbon protein